MGFTELFLIAIALSADAFAVSICKGLNMKKICYKNSTIIALFFGVFQALMPLIGWLIGSQFENYIVNYDHWIAFALLSFIGAKMLFEALKTKTDSDENANCFKISELFVLAIATSIDALAVGITFALLPDINIVSSILVIGITTFVLSFIGVIIGNNFGSRYKKPSEIIGGIILISIGLKILLEHLNFISF